MNNDHDRLSDAELDALLASAHAELLDHTQEHVDHVPGLLDLMGQRSAQPHDPPSPDQAASSRTMIELRILARTLTPNNTDDLCNGILRVDVSHLIARQATILALNAALAKTITIARLTLGLARDSDRDPDLARGLARALANDLELDLKLARTLSRTLSHSRTIIRRIGLARTFASVLRRARELAHALARDIDLAPGLARAYIFDSAYRLASILTVVLDIDFARDLPRGDRDLVLDLIRDFDLTRDLDLTRDFVRTIDRDFAHTLDRADQLHSALAGALLRELMEVPVDVLGVDLSDLQIPEITVLAGVVWTHSTTWPRGIVELIEAHSEQIEPGIFQVRIGTERDQQHSSMF